MADMSWRNTIRRFVRDVMAGDAATAAANAIPNVKSAITSRLRRGTTTVPPVTTVSQPELPRLPQQSLVTVLVVNYQPHSLRAIAGERVLSDDRYNASLFKVENVNTAMKKNCIHKTITSKIPMDESTFLTKAKITVCNLFEQHSNTKMKLKYICIMTSTNMVTGEEQLRMVYSGAVHLRTIQQQTSTNCIIL
jgi:hypothetical protein